MKNTNSRILSIGIPPLKGSDSDTRHMQTIEITEDDAEQIMDLLAKLNPKLFRLVNDENGIKYSILGASIGDNIGII